MIVIVWQKQEKADETAKIGDVMKRLYSLPRMAMAMIVM